jgi:very-short-patch-repair endonuclease
LSHYPTISDVLKSACAPRNQHLANNCKEPAKRRAKKARNDCKEVSWIHWQLKYWCIEKGIRLEKEFKFAKGRRYRADFALPDQRIIIEYQGLNSAKSGHSTLVGYTEDTERMKLANDLGYRVLYYTCINYQNILQDLEKIIKV